MTNRWFSWDSCWHESIWRYWKVFEDLWRCLRVLCIERYFVTFDGTPWYPTPLPWKVFHNIWRLRLCRRHPGLRSTSTWALRLVTWTSRVWWPKCSVRGVPCRRFLRFHCTLIDFHRFSCLLIDVHGSSSHYADYCVSSYLIIFVPKCWYVCHFGAPTRAYRSTQ